MRTVFKLSSAAAALCAVFVAQSVYAQPQIVTDVQSAGTRYAGRTATFNVLVYSPYTITYQWMAGAVGSGTYTNLSDVGNISGSATDTLVLTNLSSANEADYVLTMTDQDGSVTSGVATVTVQPAPTDTYGAAVLADDPVAYWRMNETDGSVLNDYAGGFNGTYHGGFTLAQPGISSYDTNPAVLFDGSTGGALVPYSAALNPTNFTVECWARATASMAGDGDYRTVVQSRSAGSDCSGWIVYGVKGSPDTWHLFLGNGTTAWADTPAAPIASGWNHIVGIYDGTNWVNYINGLKVLSTKWATYVPSTLGDLSIGYRRGDLHFPGYITEVAIYNTALSSNQIVNHYVQAAIGGYKAPAVTQEPQSVSVYAGLQASFSVQVQSYTTATYQWMAGPAGSSTYTNLANGGNISGATASTLVVSSVSAANAGDYVVVASNPSGSVTSSIATLTLQAPPQAPIIQQEPQSASTMAGRTAQFWVWPMGQAPMSCQWQVASQADGNFANVTDGNLLSGSTTTNLFIGNAAANMAGYYRAVISNPNGSVTSSVVQLTVQALPTLQLRMPFDAQGSDPTVAKSDTTLGSIDLTMQLTSDGSTPAALFGAPGTGLTNEFPNAQCLDQSSATCPSQGNTQPGNNKGAGTGPAAYVQGSPALAALGNNGSISNFVVSWWFNMAAYNTDWINTHLFLLDPTDQPDGGGAANTMQASIVWANQFQFYFNGTGWTINSSLTENWFPTNYWIFVAVTADKAYMGSMTEPARPCNGFNGKSGSIQMGANPSLTIGNRPGTFARSFNGRIADFRFYNGAGNQAIVETIRASALMGSAGITTQPVSATVNLGGTTTFSVAASGAQVSYQWYVNNAPIPGATSATYTTPAATAADNGKQYQVMVSNPINSQCSAAATLTVMTVQPRIEYTFSNGTLTLTWPSGTLQQATDLQGAWTPVSGASPLSVKVADAPRMFYRLVQ